MNPSILRLQNTVSARLDTHTRARPLRAAQTCPPGTHTRTAAARTWRTLPLAALFHAARAIPRARRAAEGAKWKRKPVRGTIAGAKLKVTPRLAEKSPDRKQNKERKLRGAEAGNPPAPRAAPAAPPARPLPALRSPPAPPARSLRPLPPPFLPVFVSGLCNREEEEAAAEEEE